MVRETWAGNLMVKRVGMRELGFPVGGAFDENLAGLALVLAGLEEGAVLEVGGPLVLEATGACVVGVSSMGEEILIGGRKIVGSGRGGLVTGDWLEIRRLSRSARIYVAGLGMDGLASSVSRPVKVGDEVTMVRQDGEGVLTLAEGWPMGMNGELRYVSLGQAFDGEFVVEQNSRVGVRMAGEVGFEREALVRSEPSGPGSIQLTPAGELLVHGPDGPTTGGYPKVGGVIAADFWRLGQLRFGDKVRLVEVGIEEAKTALIEQRATVAEHRRRVEFALSVHG